MQQSKLWCHFLDPVLSDSLKCTTLMPASHLGEETVIIWVHFAHSRQLAWRHMVQANLFEIIKARPCRMLSYLLHCLFWNLDFPNVLALAATFLIVFRNLPCLPFCEGSIDIFSTAPCLGLQPRSLNGSSVLAGGHMVESRHCLTFNTRDEVSWSVYLGFSYSLSQMEWQGELQSCLIETSIGDGIDSQYWLHQKHVSCISKCSKRTVSRL